MHPEKIAKTFYFEDQNVGYFEDDELPTKPGQYHYMPYRSAGHYALIGALRAGEPQRCHYVISGTRRHFMVLRLVKYGVLELGGFDASSEQQT
jgi:hypothetical protein